MDQGAVAIRGRCCSPTIEPRATLHPHRYCQRTLYGLVSM